MQLYQLYQDFYSYSKNYKGRADSTTYAYTIHLNIFRKYLCVRKHSSSVWLNAITMSAVLDFIQEVRKGTFRTRGSWPVSNKTIHHYISTIKTFLKWCYMMDYECLKWEKIPPISVEQHYIADILTASQVRAMWQCAKNEPNEVIGLRNLLIMKIAYYTGMRGQEIIKLTFNDILSPHRQVKIIGKKKRERTVHFNDDIVKVAKKLLAHYKMYDPRLLQSDHALLSLSTSWFGQPITSTTIKKFIRQYREHLGLSDKIVLHSFRHTFATTLLCGGVDIRIVQQWLGHASITSTQLYTHVPDDSVKTINTILRNSLT